MHCVRVLARWLVTDDTYVVVYTGNHVNGCLVLILHIINKSIVLLEYFGECFFC
jgi:hypothetical protein